MKRYSWIFLLILSSVSLVLAQDTCLSLEIALQETLATCDSLENDSLCYGSGTLNLESSADEEEIFEDLGDRVSISDIISFQSMNDEDVLATVMMRLNREDVAIDLIAYGQLEIENTASSNTISVYALRGVNLRQEPSVEATVLGSLTQRQTYTAIGRLADNAWLQIRLDDGRVGWVSAQYFSSSEGFTELEAVTPTSLIYLPMQSLTLTTDDCSGLLIIAPEIEGDKVVFAINGAQIQGAGIINIYIEDDFLIINVLEGEAIVNTFGFETVLSSGELTTIQLGATNTIINIASEAESSNLSILSEEMIAILLTENQP